MIDLLPLPNVQVVAVCDPNKDSDNYVDWSKDGMRSGIANAIGKPDWRAGIEQRIEELKPDLAADGFCLQPFFATEAARSWRR